MILVLGATGTIGGEVARQLIAAGERPRLLVRTPDRARAFEGNAEIVRGDLTDANSLRAAMKGIEKVFLVSAGGDLVKLEGNAVDAAASSTSRPARVGGQPSIPSTSARWAFRRSPHPATRGRRTP